MAVDPLVSSLLVVAISITVGAFAGILFERTRGPAAKRAAKFEAELVQARSELMHYQDQTKHHFGKSAELLGRMASDYREFLDHFVAGAESLCGPNMKELNANGLERPLLDGTAPATAVAPSPQDLPVESAAPIVPLPPLESDPLIEETAK